MMMPLRGKGGDDTLNGDGGNDRIRGVPGRRKIHLELSFSSAGWQPHDAAFYSRISVLVLDRWGGQGKHYWI